MFWLIREGVLTGRLHDSKSASVLKEQVTGNSRSDDYSSIPMVRMTNTYMATGRGSWADCRNLRW